MSIAFITGANKGIGLEIARQIGKTGVRVLVGARSPERGETAAALLRAQGIDAHFIEIDLSKRITIKAATDVIADMYGRLDILVNNAGITDPADGPPSIGDLDAVRHVFDVNFFGTLAITQAMLPFLRKSASGRIVNVSSGLGSLTHNGDPEWEGAKLKLMGYNGSKAALNMLTVQLAAELKDTGIKVNSAEPGPTATDLNGHQGYQSIAQGAAIAIRLALLPADGPTGRFFSASREEPW